MHPPSCFLCTPTRSPRLPWPCTQGCPEGRRQRQARRAEPDAEEAQGGKNGQGACDLWLVACLACLDFCLNLSAVAQTGRRPDGKDSHETGVQAGAKPQQAQPEKHLLKRGGSESGGVTGEGRHCYQRGCRTNHALTQLCCSGQQQIECHSSELSHCQTASVFRFCSSCYRQFYSFFSKGRARLNTWHWPWRVGVWRSMTDRLFAVQRQLVGGNRIQMPRLWAYGCC